MFAHRKLRAHTKSALTLGTLLITALLPIGIAHSTPQTQTFSYTGASQDYVVPAGVTEVLIEAWGAQGGGGGLGGHTRGRYPVTPGETLNVYVGETPYAFGVYGGFNGGGTGGVGSTGGGGASDVRQAGNALADRIIVAGGGGGTPFFGDRGASGGGIAGMAGMPFASTGGLGGTQIAGGAGGLGSTANGQAGILGIGGDGGMGGGGFFGGGGGGGGGFFGGGGGGGTSINSGGGGGGGSGFIGTSISPDTLTENGVRSGNGLVTITSGLYPSDDCTDPAVFDGYAGNGYAKLRTGSVAGGTWVCAAVDDGTNHLGGKVEIPFAVGLPDPQPGQGLTCSTQPENIPVRSGTVAGGQPYRLDITPSPGGANEVWVCVQATTSVDYRIVIRTGGVAVPGFEPDLTVPHPAYPSPISPGAASSYCQANGGTRLLNAEINGSRVWLYAKQDSTTRANVCLRSQAASTGKKLTVDSAGGPVSVATTNLPQCTFEVITDNGPPPFSIFTSSPGSVPAAACAQVAGTYASIKADPGGGVGVVTQTSD